jgi:hypothetical protein
VIRLLCGALGIKGTVTPPLNHLSYVITSPDISSITVSFHIVTPNHGVLRLRKKRKRTPKGLCPKIHY